MAYEGESEIQTQELQVSIYQNNATWQAGEEQNSGVNIILSGLSLSATGRILRVTAQSVMRWIRKMYDRIITERADISEVKEVEMDEMHHYYQKKLKNFGSGKDHRSKNLTGWAFEHRDTRTLIRMRDHLGFEEIPHIYADCYESCKEFFPAKNLTQSKRHTSPTERNNGRQRHWLAAFRRRSVVVTKSLGNLEKTMALFVRFRINGSIDELLALLK